MNCLSLARNPSFRSGMAVLVIAMLGFSACVCTRTTERDENPDENLLSLVKGFALDRDLLTKDLAVMTMASHPFGSERQAVVAAHLAKRLEEAGLAVSKETFNAAVPNPAALKATGPVRETFERSGINLHVKVSSEKSTPCVVLIGSHYDTKDIAGLDYLGANDSGSSTTTLIQQMVYLERFADKTATVCAVRAVFLDGEEAVLPDWNDGYSHPAKQQDNTYGSRHLAARLTSCSYEGISAKCLPADLGGQPVVAFVLMDLIGSPGIKISTDSNSSAALTAKAKAGSRLLGHADLFTGNAKSIADDHIPFAKAGVAVIDLIDFEHLDYWHAFGDETANVSPESMEIAGRVALYTAIAVAQNPKVFLQSAE